MLKAIIFDADNTLYKVVNERAYSEMFGYIAAQTHLDRKLLENAWRAQVKNVLQSIDAQNIEKRSREYSLEAVLSHFGISDAKKRKKIAKGALDIFWNCIIEDLEFEKGTRKTILELSKKYTLAIASDEYEKFLQMKLNRVFKDWRKYFKFLISCESVGEMKPSEKYFEIALVKLGVSPDKAAVVGDSPLRDTIPAKKLGMLAVLVSDEKADDAADITIKSLPELKSALE